jgi:two-component system, LytTR family, sensor kinase
MAYPFNPDIKPRQLPGFGLLFAAWTVLGLFAYARYWLIAADRVTASTLPELLGWLACYYSWLLLTLPVFHLETRFSLGPGRRLWNLPILLIAGSCFSYLAYQINLALNQGLHLLFPGQPRPVGIAWSVPMREFALEFALYLFTLVAACVYRNLYELRRKERLAAQLALEKSQLEASLRQAQLETLRMRLNPHFLFNCLQNIATLSQQQPKVAAQMVTKLGNLLRSALRQTSESESTLDAELTLTRAYLDIEQMRFPDRLSIFFDIAPGTELALVPVLLLQPLVENSIHHGMRGNRRNLLLRIGSSRAQNDLLLTVSDSGVGFGRRTLSEIELGTGLGATCERLARMYPGQHSFSVRDLPEGGAEISIVLPLRFKQTIADTTHDENLTFADRR